MNIIQQKVRALNDIVYRHTFNFVYIGCIVALIISTSLETGFNFGAILLVIIFAGMMLLAK